MSRSIRKHPWVTDQQGKDTKKDKRKASRKVRKSDEVPSGKAYRKFSNPWDICDWKWLDPKRAKRK